MLEKASTLITNQISILQQRGIRMHSFVVRHCCILKDGDKQGRCCIFPTGTWEAAPVAGGRWLAGAAADEAAGLAPVVAECRPADASHCDGGTVHCAPQCPTCADGRGRRLPVSPGLAGSAPDTAQVQTGRLSLQSFHAHAIL